MTVGSSQKNGIYYMCQKVKNGMKGHYECDNGTIVARIADAKAWKEAQAIILNPAVLDEELEKRRTGDPAREEIEERRERILRKRVNWQKAQERVDAFKLWCDAHREQLASDGYTPTFEEKQTALFELGLIARVYRKDQEKELGYRMAVEFSPPTVMSVLTLDRFIYLTGRNLR